MADRSVEVRLGLDVSDFAAGAKRAGSALGDVGTKAESLGKESQTAFQKASRHVKDNAAEYRTLGAAMTGIGATMTAMSFAVAKTGIEYNTLQQSSRAALGVIMGGAKQANAQMDRLDAFARTSPFSKQVFIEAQRQMLGFGIEAQKVVPYLDAIQNATAAMGGSNEDIAQIVDVFAKIKSQGKLTARELIQLGGHGLDAATLIGEAMGKTGSQIRDEITAGTLGADQALDALAEGMQGRFGGAADAVKQQFEGALDRVKAAFRDFSSSAMAPFVDPEGGGLLVDWTNSFADLIRFMDELPGPAKTGIAVLTGLGGVAMTAAGGFLMLAPRLVATKEALDKLAESSKLAAGISNAFGSLKGAALPVAGIVGAATAAFVLFAREQQKFRADVEEYKSTINELVSAGKSLEEGATQQALESLTTSEIIPWFQQFATAGRDVKDVLADAGISTVSFAEAIGQGGAEAQAMQQHLEALHASGQISTQEFMILNDALWSMVGRADEAKGQVQDLADAEDELAGATDGAASAMEAAADAVDRYRSALQQLSDWHDRNAASAQNYYDAHARAEETMSGLTEAIRENAAAGEEQWSTLSGAASDIKSYRDAMIEATDANGEAKFSAEEVTSAVGPMIQAWADAASQAGYTDAEVQQLVSDVFGLADGLDSLPENVDIAVAANASDAAAELAAIEAQLDGLPLEVITAIAARDDATEVVAAVSAAMDAGVPAEVITMLIANDEASGVLLPLADRIAALPTSHNTDLEATDLTGGPTSSATGNIDGVPKKSMTPLEARDQTGPATRRATQAIRAVPSSKSSTITAIDNASGTLANIRAGIAGINSKSVTMTVTRRTIIESVKALGKRAMGGPIWGPGTGTSDDVPILASDGEHMWTAREVIAAGGHSAVYALRQAVMDGRLRLAEGGKPGLPMPVEPSPHRYPATSPAPEISVYVTNPFTGKEVKATVARTVVEYLG